MIEIKTYILNNIDSLIAYVFGAGGVFSWYKEKQKRQTDALSGMQQSYDKFVEDSDKKFESMRQEISDLKVSHKNEIEHLKLRYESELTSLRNQLQKVEESWRKKYNDLKNGFNDYKKKHP